ncbi:peptidoglycan-binding protein [Paenirhodobacter enshiensis]|uniref:peptidoglycan-binding protein n=1 Tax=Paenirhodobacter enshiensis TaxID=1105367 RepID=UPI003FA23A5A
MTVDLTRGETGRVLSVAAEAGLSAPQTAYVLATACWETAGTMRPVREAFYLGARAGAYRDGLRYAPWYGRGFVQLTWRANYLRAGEALGVDLLADPDRALEPDIAARVLVRGMTEGWFTGRRLGQFISAGGSDFIEARRIVNGLDCADRIAALADDYEAALTPLDTALLRRGMQGAPVARLQRALARGLGQALTDDGRFGALTEAALRAFQRARGLTEDGIAGPLSWAMLITEEEIPE